MGGSRLGVGEVWMAHFRSMGKAEVAVRERAESPESRVRQVAIVLNKGKGYQTTLDVVGRGGRHRALLDVFNQRLPEVL